MCCHHFQRDECNTFDEMPSTLATLTSSSVEISPEMEVASLFASDNIFQRENSMAIVTTIISLGHLLIFPFVSADHLLMVQIRFEKKTFHNGNSRMIN